MTDEEIIEKVYEMWENMEDPFIGEDWDEDAKTAIKEALRLKEEQARTQVASQLRQKEQECEKKIKASTAKALECSDVIAKSERSRIKKIVEDMVKEYQDLALKTEDTLHLHGIGAVITGLEELLSKIGGEVE